MAEKRNTVLLRVRALHHEAEALRAEAKRRGVPLSWLVLDLAAGAGLVEHRGDPVRSTTGAPRSTGSAQDRPALAARVEALEARVLALEAGPGPAAPRPAAARPAPAEAPAVKRTPKARSTTPGGVRFAATDPRRPVERSELPPGFPATGAELVAWRESAGLPRSAFGRALAPDGGPAAARSQAETFRQQEAKGDAPVSVGLALRLVAAVEAGDLPAPG